MELFSASRKSSTGCRPCSPSSGREVEDRIHELEAEISRTETVITECETALQDFVSADETQLQSQELDRNKTTHATLIKEWEELSESLQEAD